MQRGEPCEELLTSFLRTAGIGYKSTICRQNSTLSKLLIEWFLGVGQIIFKLDFGDPIQQTYIYIDCQDGYKIRGKIAYVMNSIDGINSLWMQNKHPSGPITQLRIGYPPPNNTSFLRVSRWLIGILFRRHFNESRWKMEGYKKGRETKD